MTTFKMLYFLGMPLLGTLAMQVAADLRRNAAYMIPFDLAVVLMLYGLAIAYAFGIIWIGQAISNTPKSVYTRPTY